jgi:hypothetical protein
VSGIALKPHNAVSAANIQTLALGSNPTMIVGFAYQPGDAINDDGRVVGFYQDNTEHFTLRAQSSGEVSAYRGTTHIATSSGAGLATNAWCYIEVRAKIGNAGTGAYEIRVNGVTVLSDADEDTQNGGSAFANNVRFWGNNTSTAANRCAFDDIWIVDESGSALNTFLGSQKVVAIFPNAEGDASDFTPSSESDNSAMVDENGHDADSTYVESGTSGHQDLYAMQDLSGLSTILGVQQNLLCRETDGTPFSIKPVCKSDTTVGDGSPLAIGGTTYRKLHRIYENDPDTAAAWTDIGLDAAQFGFEVN